MTEFHWDGNNLIKERFIDYEGYVFEPTVSYNIRDNFEIGLTGRIHGYYAGLFDPVFQGFHDLFGFPNGGRDSYPQKDVYINLHTTTGIDLYMTEPTVTLGDTDLFIK